MLKIPSSYFQNDVIYENINADPQNGQIGCGFLYRTGTNYYNLRFQNYSGVYILKGHGLYQDVTGRSIKVSAGDYLQRLPGLSHSTVIYPSEDWLEFFTHFGTNTYENLANLNMMSREPVIRPGLSSYLFNKCTYLLEYMKKHHQDEKAFCHLKLQELSVEIYQRSILMQTEPGMQRYMKQAAEMLCTAPTFPSPAQVAADLEIDYDLFRKKFKVFYHTSPYAYQLNGRINHSKTLLLNTNMTLNEIALICGFADGYAYSKAFKKQYGISPSAFRQMHLL